MGTFFSIFIDVIMPVFGIVLIGYVLGGRLELQSRTLTRAAYYIFVPAFIFRAIGGSRLPFDQVSIMLVFIVTTHLLTALLAGGIGRLLRRPREIIAAFVMVAVSGNVGNFGLAIIRFRLGEASLPSATIYYVVLSILAFIVSVGAAGWARGGRRGALGGILKTPAIWAMFPALLMSHFEWALPTMLSRMIGLLADAMIPVMLFSLGLQLLEQKQIRVTRDVLTASSLRLLLNPALACLVAIPFGLGHLEYASGVLQAGMPTAVMATIIAKENDIVPHFVTSVVLFSVLLSLVTLPTLMTLL